MNADDASAVMVSPPIVATKGVVGVGRGSGTVGELGLGWLAGAGAEEAGVPGSAAVGKLGSGLPGPTTAGDEGLPGFTTAREVGFPGSAAAGEVGFPGSTTAGGLDACTGELVAGFPGSTCTGEDDAGFPGSTITAVVVGATCAGVVVAGGVTKGGVDPGSALALVVVTASGDVTGGAVVVVEPKPPRPAAYL